VLVRDHDRGRRVVAVEQLVLVVQEVVLAVPQDASGSAQSLVPRGGGREKDSRAVQSTASELLARLSCSGTDASSRSSQVACSPGVGSPSGLSLPAAFATSLKVYST